MTMKTRWSKTYGMQEKQFQEGSLQQYNPTSRNKKISNKQPKLTSKAIREKRPKKNQSEQKERNHKIQMRNKCKRNEVNNSKDQ